MGDKYEEIRFDVSSEEKVDVSILETMEFNYPGSSTEVEFEFPEFTSVCPWTGLPDFGNLVIRFIPKNKLVELKSLKYYLHTYRDVGILQEHVVNKILNDLVSIIEPYSMEVSCDFLPRGGIKTVATAVYPDFNDGCGCE